MIIKFGLYKGWNAKTALKDLLNIKPIKKLPEWFKKQFKT